MEVHAPDHPVLTFKQFVVHIFIVTIGIIIALSLEGTLEWWHHRALVHETRTNLRNELQSNQKSVQKVLEGLGPAKKRFIHALEVVSDLPARGSELSAEFSPVSDGLLQDISFAWLNTASYKTAQVTGALGLMEYGDAFKYSDIYDLQEIYIRMQDAAERDAFMSYMLGAGMLAKPSQAEIEDAKRQLRIGLGALLPMESLTKKLGELYERALKDEP